ncbi:MAG: response regulator [Candidatus Uhrbacteria bacterium]
MDTNIKILLADDSAFMRKVLKDILVGMGFGSFVEAENGVEALAKYAEEKPGLLLLDIIMPEKDGMEVLKEIGKTAKIVVVSAIGQDSMIEEAKGLGALDYITKPFDKKNVEEVLGKVLA